MDQQKAEAMVATLCNAFDLPCPKVKVWNKGSGRAHYHPRKREIYLSSAPGPTAGPRDMTVLHEFSHYVFHARKDFAKDRGQYDWHGALFTSILIEVSEFWYGDPTRYGWKREYAQVRRRARKQLAEEHGCPESALQF